MTATGTLRDILGGNDAGIVRCARKAHRCVCADRLYGYDVRGLYPGGVTTHPAASMDDAIASRERMLDRPANRGGVRFSGVEIEERPNPNYRPDCLGAIAPGDLYFEYTGEREQYQMGSPYCSRCAVAAWVS